MTDAGPGSRHDLPAGGRAFVKMEGAGNDFVVLDDRDDAMPPSPDEVRRLCDRRRGVGADGLLWIARIDAGSVRVAYWNRDGGAAFCGNGARCAARHAVVEGLVDGPALTLVTDEAALEAQVTDDQVVVAMPAPTPPVRVAIPELGPGLGAADLLSVGVPHLVFTVPDVDAIDLDAIGPVARAHPAVGPDGANVDLVARDGDGGLVLRTYERGVEGETLACGTGAVAVARVDGADALHVVRRVRTRGGDWLTVTIEGEGTGARARLEGPARITFAGRVSWR